MPPKGLVVRKTVVHIALWMKFKVALYISPYIAFMADRGTCCLLEDDKDDN